MKHEFSVGAEIMKTITETAEFYWAVLQELLQARAAKQSQTKYQAGRDPSDKKAVLDHMRTQLRSMGVQPK